MAAYDAEGGLLAESAAAPFALATDETTNRLASLQLAYEDAEGDVTLAATGTAWTKTVTGVEGVYTVAIDETTDAAIYDLTPLEIVATATGTDGTTTTDTVTITRTIPSPVQYGVWLEEATALDDGGSPVGESTGGTEASPVTTLSTYELPWRMASIQLTFGGAYESQFSPQVTIADSTLGWTATMTPQTSELPDIVYTVEISELGDPEIYDEENLALTITMTDTNETYTMALDVTRTLPNAYLEGVGIEAPVGEDPEFVPIPKNGEATFETQTNVSRIYLYWQAGQEPDPSLQYVEDGCTLTAYDASGDPLGEPDTDRIRKEVDPLDPTADPQWYIATAGYFTAAAYDIDLTWTNVYSEPCNTVLNLTRS